MHNTSSIECREDCCTIDNRCTSWLRDIDIPSSITTNSKGLISSRLNLRGTIESEFSRDRSSTIDIKFSSRGSSTNTNSVISCIKVKKSCSTIFNIEGGGIPISKREGRCISKTQACSINRYRVG